MTTLVWFRQDLRTGDNPAFHEAARRGPVLPVFIQGEARQVGEAHPLGGASRWWLHHSLAALKKSVPALVLLRGSALHLIPQLARRAGVSAVFWNHCYEPHAIERDDEIEHALKNDGLEVRRFNAALLHDPKQVKTRSGDGPFKVYTPFWRAVQKLDIAHPLPAPAKVTLAVERGAELDDLELLPMQPNWAAGWEQLWQPGEKGAQTRLQAFLGETLKDYGPLRDRPDLQHVSRLSPHLHFGEISPRQVWHEVRKRMAADEKLAEDAMKFLSEIGWREFSAHLLYHFPRLPSANWRPAFDDYPWRENEDDLARWQKGLTGYPIVDAGMRELWKTGYMHNRVRMITASFLVKHLRLHWRHGESWFRDTLVDADLASNSANWQWVAGSGADAAPYFRIFNPFTQGRKFDPQGSYIRRWVPELKDLATIHLFAPFEAPQEVLQQAGVELGRTYPLPIVDHAKARQAALEGYEAVKRAGQNAS